MKFRIEAGMQQQQQQQTTPLQSVKECCRRLRQEWEDMIQNADVISSEVLSSLKAQEAALIVEQKQVQLLKLETHILRRSFSQTTQKQETKALADRKLADEIKVNIQSQLGEVKQLQHQLAIQLAKMRDSMEKIKTSKQQESANSLLLGSATSELPKSVSHEPLEQLDLKIVLPLEDEDAGLPHLRSCFPTAQPGRLLLDVDNKSFRLKDKKASAITSQHVFEQNHFKSKSEVSRGGTSQVLRGDQKDHLQSRSKSTSSLALARGSEPDWYQVDHVCVKAKFDENTGGSLKNVSAACNPSGLESDADELDKVVLSERLEMLLQKNFARRQTKLDDVGIPDVELLEKKKPLGGDRNLVSKRKWEVPIETALQEDAPGLLEKLQERGLLEDMTIYGVLCEDDWGNGDEHFKDLECIAKKIWGGASGLIKFPHIRQHGNGLGKGAMYCLSCLVSLIDQAKTLRQRNWPVEWGWCRELQAFIFVFDKHNRVVLERPEYGNATYFFELVQFLPVKWQVLRLIHVLSVTALGKTALLENRPLEVGFEVTADECKILEGFGWAKGTGLGSFLNFCDRVCHDVKEDDNVEWRQKIGKCLMDGYDKGRIMAPALPAKLSEGLNKVNLEADIKPSAVILT